MKSYNLFLVSLERGIVENRSIHDRGSMEQIVVHSLLKTPVRVTLGLFQEAGGA